MRRYVTYNQYTELISSSLDEATFNQLVTKAESDVDSLIATSLTGGYAKADTRQLRFTASFTSETEATLSSTYTLNDDEQYLVIKILSGANTGLVRAITANTGNSITFDSIEGLSTPSTAQVIVYQAGKAPFLCDSDETAKWINEDIINATIYQIEHLASVGAKARTSKRRKSESVSTSSTSYTLESTQELVNSKVDIAPKTLEIMAKYGIHTIS